MAKVSVVHPFDRIDEWSVKRHGVKIHINKSPIAYWNDGISLDVEDDGKGNFVGLGVYLPDTKECYYISELRYLINQTIPKFIAHNGISDIRKLQTWGFKVDESHLLHDTQLIEHILDSSKKAYGLKDICKRLGIGEWPDYLDIVGKKKQLTLKDFPIESVAAYNAADTYYTYKLYENQRTRLF